MISHHPPVSQQRGQYCQGVFGCPEPSHPGVSPPPHPLPASELAGAVHSAYDRFVQRHAVFNVREQLPVPEGLASRARQPSRPSRQRSDLIGKPGLQHRREPTLDTTRHNLSWQPDTGEPPRCRRESSHAGTVTGKGAAAANCHLQRPQYTPAVDRPGAGCRGRVELGKPAVQFGGARGLFKLSGYLGPPARNCEAVDKRVHVKAGTANEKGALTARRDIGNDLVGLGHKTSHVPGLRRVGYVDHVMGDAGSLFRAGFAVPMSMPLYTCIESAVTISISPSWSATMTPIADLPEAVGPTNAKGPGAVEAFSWPPPVSGCDGEAAPALARIFL